jgi:hypothetical protein
MHLGVENVPKSTRLSLERTRDFRESPGWLPCQKVVTPTIDRLFAAGAVALFPRQAQPDA